MTPTVRIGAHVVTLTERQVRNYLAKVGEPDEHGCRAWTARLDRYGYGMFAVKPHCAVAHRIGYQLLVGPIPDGLDLDHLCRNRRCQTPEHLEPVTRRVNTMRSPVARGAVNARKTTCANGHALDGDNLHVDPAGYRHCRDCARAANTRWKRGESNQRGAPSQRAEYQRDRYRERAAAHP